MLDRSRPAAAPMRQPLTRRGWWRHLIAPSPAPPPDTLIRVRRTAMACEFDITLPAHRPSAIDAARRALDDVDALEAQLTVFRDSNELATARSAVGMAGVALDAGACTVHFTKTGRVNLGSIGKGRALDRVAALLAALRMRPAPAFRPMNRSSGRCA